jgi:hypothetical protein
MYNGYDWYGRIIEVREVGIIPAYSAYRAHTACLFRIATLASQVDVAAAAAVALTAVSVVAEEVLVDVVDTVECPTRTCTLITLAPTNKWVRELTLNGVTLVLTLRCGWRRGWIWRNA